MVAGMQHAHAGGALEVPAGHRAPARRQQALPARPQARARAPGRVQPPGPFLLEDEAPRARSSRSRRRVPAGSSTPSVRRALTAAGAARTVATAARRRCRRGRGSRCAVRCAPSGGGCCRRFRRGRTSPRRRAGRRPANRRWIRRPASLSLASATKKGAPAVAAIDPVPGLAVVVDEAACGLVGVGRMRRARRKVAIECGGRSTAQPCRRPTAACRAGWRVPVARHPRRHRRRVGEGRGLESWRDARTQHPPRARLDEAREVAEHPVRALVHQASLRGVGQDRRAAEVAHVVGAAASRPAAGSSRSSPPSSGSGR